MSRLVKKAALQQSDPDMTPMLDIVFILLIFFIVTTSFVKEHTFLVNRPNQASSPPTEVKSVYVEIKENGNVYIQNRQVSLESIAINIAKLSAEFDISGISIKAHEGSAHRVLMSVIDNIKLVSDSPVAVITKN